MDPAQSYAGFFGGVHPTQLVDQSSRQQAFLPLAGPSSTKSSTPDTKPKTNGAKTKKRAKDDSPDSGDDAPAGAEGGKKPTAKRNRAALS